MGKKFQDKNKTKVNQKCVSIFLYNRLNCNYLDELEKLGFFHQSSDFDATQVMYCIDNEPSPTAEDTLIIEQSPENIPTKQAPEVKDDFYKDFAFPEMLDDEKDDFSWLMKVCPTPSNQSDQTVPGEDFHALESASNFNSIKKTKLASPSPPEESASMLLDAMLSEMDVSSLITNDFENEITFHKDEATNDEINENPKLLAHDNMKSSKSRTKKRSLILRNRTTTALTETPISLRRSQRKRSFTEMIQTEVIINKANNVTGSNQRKNKRPRLQSTPRESKIPKSKNNTDMSAVAVAITESNTSSLPQPEAIVMLDEKPVKNKLIIKFRKSKPVNPIEKSFVSNRAYQRGLIDPSKMLSGQIYLTRSCSPKLMPIIEENASASKWVAKPMVPKKIKELLKMEWIMNHNTLANVKAHGKEMLGSKKLTSDGNAVRGTFATMDLDNDYESILQFQNEIQCVVDWKSNLLSKTHDLTEIENPISLDNTFSNFSNFNNYFNEQLPSDGNNLDDDDDTESTTQDDELDNGIVGAVSVNKVALSKSSSVLIENWSVFKIKGQHYRSNPGVVIVERLSDHVIEQMQSKPKKVTLESPYYKALTSYFETRSSSIK